MYDQDAEGSEEQTSENRIGEAFKHERGVKHHPLTRNHIKLQKQLAPIGSVWRPADGVVEVGNIAPVERLGMPPVNMTPCGMLLRSQAILHCAVFCPTVSGKAMSRESGLTQQTQKNLSACRVQQVVWGLGLVRWLSCTSRARPHHFPAYPCTCTCNI